MRERGRVRKRAVGGVGRRGGRGEGEGVGERGVEGRKG